MIEIFGLWCLVVVILFFAKELGKAYPLVFFLIVLMFVILAVATCIGDSKPKYQEEEETQIFLDKEDEWEIVKDKK